MSDFAEFLVDVFHDFGEISCRRMFGGLGVFHEGLMFALVADDVLYFKVDDSTAALYKERDLPPFQYAKGGKMVKLSYCQAPAEIYDSPEEAAMWAKRAYEVALLARKKK